MEPLKDRTLEEYADEFWFYGGEPKIIGPCSKFVDDWAVCYSDGTPKGQCINCGYGREEHSPNENELQVGAVYFDSEEKKFFIRVGEEIDSQGDVLVLNFDGTIGYAHFEVCSGVTKIANNLTEYINGNSFH
jgi:hypothetical protein